ESADALADLLERGNEIPARDRLQQLEPAARTAVAAVVVALTVAVRVLETVGAAAQRAGRVLAPQDAFVHARAAQELTPRAGGGCRWERAADGARSGSLFGRHGLLQVDASARAAPAGGALHPLRTVEKGAAVVRCPVSAMRGSGGAPGGASGPACRASEPGF